MSMLFMPALTLTQPWASLMAIGAKRIETRNWSTNYRGLMAIHAAKGFPREAREFCQGDVPYFHLTETFGWEVEDLPLGAIVAVGELVDCRLTTGMTLADVVQHLDGVYEAAQDEMELGDYSPGRFAWLFRNVVSVDPPISCRGALGLWAPPVEVLDQIEAQLKAAA